MSRALHTSLVGLVPLPSICTLDALLHLGARCATLHRYEWILRYLALWRSKSCNFTWCPDGSKQKDFHLMWLSSGLVLASKRTPEVGLSTKSRNWARPIKWWFFIEILLHPVQQICANYSDHDRGHHFRGRAPTNRIERAFTAIDRRKWVGQAFLRRSTLKVEMSILQIQSLRS